MRAIKTDAELEKLRTASELITDSMLATIAWAREGTTKAEIIEQPASRGNQSRRCISNIAC